VLAIILVGIPSAFVRRLRIHFYRMQLKFINKDLTTDKVRLKYREIPRTFLHIFQRRRFRIYDSKPSPSRKTRITSLASPACANRQRDEDAEFVECLECREIFESSELRDMSIEESVDRRSPGNLSPKPSPAMAEHNTQSHHSNYERCIPVVPLNHAASLRAGACIPHVANSCLR